MFKLPSFYWPMEVRVTERSGNQYQIFVVVELLNVMAIVFLAYILYFVPSGEVEMKETRPVSRNKTGTKCSI